MQIKVEGERKFDQLLSKVSVYFFYLLIIYLPLYEFVLHFLESYTRLPDKTIFWICHFYEPLIVLLVLAYLVKFLIERKLPKFEKNDLYITAFVFLALILAFVHFSDLSRGLQGLRFLILPYIIYLLVRVSGYKNPRRMISVYIWIAAILATIGVVEYFLLPRDYMTTYWKIANFGFGQNSLLSTPQATSLLAGPNQLASYLLLAFFYLLHRYFVSKKQWFLEPDNYLLLIVTAAIGLTYSRAALLGLVVASIWMFIYFGHEQRKKIIYAILFIVSMITLAVAYALQNGELVRDLLTHGSSFTQHLSSTRDSFMTFVRAGMGKVLLGFGVGSAGPTALTLGGVISENYYIQILYETGVLGLGLFLAFIFSTLVKLYKSSKTVFFALIALLINAMFLHIFSDNPAMAVSVFIVVAVIMNLGTSSNK